MPSALVRRAGQLGNFAATVFAGRRVTIAMSTQVPVIWSRSPSGHLPWT